MENTPNIELFIQFEEESEPESFSMKPTDKFEVLWMFCAKRISNIDAISIASSGTHLSQENCQLTIQDLEIGTNTTLIVHAAKPESAVLNGNGTKSIISVEKKGEERSKITKGINLRGKCPNSKCKAFKKLVVVQVGFKKCDVIDKLADSKCPICQEFFEPDTFIYFDCRYQIRGLYIDRTLKTNSKIRVEPNSWECTESKKVHSYAPDASGNKIWLELEITAKSLDEVT